jgi:hypothetical protein
MAEPHHRDCEDQCDETFHPGFLLSDLCATLVGRRVVVLAAFESAAWRAGAYW